MTAFVVLASALGAQVTNTSSVIDSEQVGTLRLGSTVENAYGIFGRDRTRIVDLFYEGFFTPALEIILAGRTSPTIRAFIVSTPCGFRITEADVSDSSYVTPEGIRVGSTVAEVKDRLKVEFSNEEGDKLISMSPFYIFRAAGDLRNPKTRIDRIFVRLGGTHPANPCP